MSATITDRDLLNQVNAAILAITTTGQTYSIGNRSLTRANITELRHLKDQLEARIAADDGSGTSLLGGVSVAFFEGR